MGILKYNTGGFNGEPGSQYQERNQELRCRWEWSRD